MIIFAIRLIRFDQSWLPGGGANRGVKSWRQRGHFGRDEGLPIVLESLKKTRQAWVTGLLGAVSLAAGEPNDQVPG